MRRAMTAVLAIVGLGCGGDPRESRLAQGAKVVVVNPGAEGVEMSNTTEHATKSNRLQLKHLGQKEITEEVVDTGTRATVISDESPNVDAGRPVKVFLRDGEHEGLKGEIRREHLQPE